VRGSAYPPGVCQEAQERRPCRLQALPLRPQSEPPDPPTGPEAYAQSASETSPTRPRAQRRHLAVHVREHPGRTCLIMPGADPNDRRHSRRSSASGPCPSDASVPDSGEVRGPCTGTPEDGLNESDGSAQPGGTVDGHRLATSPTQPPLETEQVAGAERPAVDAVRRPKAGGLRLTHVR
jgi:hypothetical protein